MNNDKMENMIPSVVFIMLCIVRHVVHSQAANCTAAGRFADTSDATCQNYTLCVYNSSSGSYLAYYYHCESNSVFNPNTAQCTASTNYACNNTATSNDEPVPACVAEGFFEDERSTDCSTFIACVAFDGIFIESNYTCATGSYFDPDLQECSFDYVCPTVCTSAGRFANTMDNTCGSFYTCVEAPDGTFVQAHYTCPSPSLFNPKTKLCSTLYKCM